MNTEQKFTEAEAHKKFAVELFNKIWGLLSKEDRTEDENEQMLWLAFASLYHWSIAGTEINLQRGEWMVSHVYSVLNRPEPALHHAKRCLQLTEKHKFGDFDLAYSYEAMARALFCSGQRSEGEKYFKLAKEAGENIKQKEDRDIFQGDLNTGPWFRT